MAINKRKILQSAQKHLQKGALDKALKDYQTLLKADPKDPNVRLKIGDIYLKQGNSDEAIAAYLKVAESFMASGFDAKAVALYKQITKIDEKRVDVFVPLAELYERMGLQSDALKALQQAADIHYREGRKDEALDLLRRMASLDPGNTASRMKVADLLRQEERTDEAIAEYEAVVEELQRQGAEEDRIRVLVRVLELDPSRIDLMASVGRSRLDTGNFEAAEKTARMMIESQSDEPDGYLILGEACDGLERTEEKVAAYRRAAEIHRERGNDDVARDITQRFVAPGSLDEASPEAEAEVEDDMLLGAEVEDLAGEDPELSDPGFDPNGMVLGSPIESLTDDAPEEAPEETSASGLPPLPGMEAEVAEEALEEAPANVDGDPEQLLAEASVYLRYGKHDRAIESLRSIVARDPDHALAFAKLGEALQGTGQDEHAVTAYSRGAEAAQRVGDQAAFQAIQGSLSALDPAAAEALGEPPEAPVGAEASSQGAAAAEEVEIAHDGESDSEVEIALDGESDSEVEIALD
ncbi:MAG: hypothetical protein CL910_00400, partial [Deltaproteobacteria bacterium]|nr:hypothetical protein [Deltaproteobacteria bacterium]